MADRDGEVVGFAYACPHRARPAYRWAVEVSVYVTADEHGQGYGRALYGELIERLRRQRFQVACAGITLPNEASVALHESLGFVSGRASTADRLEGRVWRDVGWWQLELQPPGAEQPAEPLPPEP